MLAAIEEIAGKRQRLADLRDPETARMREGFEKLLEKVEALPDEPVLTEVPLSTSEQSKSDGVKGEVVEIPTLASDDNPLDEPK